MATHRILAIAVALSFVVAPHGAGAGALVPSSEKLTPKDAGSSPYTNAPLSGATRRTQQAAPVDTESESVSAVRPASPPGTPRLAISVSTDKGIYRDGETVQVKGKVQNLNGDRTPAVVEVVIYRILVSQAPTTPKDESATAPRAQPVADDAPRAVYRTLIETKGNEFSDAGYIVQFASSDKFLKSDTVEYSVEANARPIGRDVPDGDLDSGGDSVPIFATTSFSAERVGLLVLGVLVYPMAAALLVLIIVYLVFMAQARKRSARWTLLAVYVLGLFALLGALGGPLLISSSRSTEKLLREAPVGLAKTATTDGGAVQWVVNVGGVVGESIVTGGYSVPLFVIILSLVGGVISMLLKLPDFLAEYDLIPEKSEGENAAVGELRAGVFRQFMYIITAPFLGMGVYSISALAEYRNAFALSVMSLAVGFVSQQIVDAMMSFSTNVLTRGADSAKKGQPDAPDAATGEIIVAGNGTAAVVTPPNSINGGQPGQGAPGAATTPPATG